MHEADERHSPFNFGKEVAEAPAWLQEVVQSHESLPWRRRNFERKGVLDQLLTTAGFPTQWKNEAEEKSLKSSSANGVAALPPEVPEGPELELARPEVFDAVRSAVLATGDPQVPTRIALHGLGGAGKTT